MSRTTRKPRFFVKTTEVKHINRDLAYAIRFPEEYLKVKLTEEELEAELEAEYQRALAEYNSRMHELKRSFWWYLLHINSAAPCYKRDYDRMTPKVPVKRVSGYKRVAVKKDLDQVIAESKKDFATFTRDGKWNETGRNTGFKQAANKLVRRANKRLCSAVMRGEDNDCVAYPNEHLGDNLVWSFW